MKNPIMTIESNDLKVLYVSVKHAYNGMGFNEWVSVTKKSYIENYFNLRENPKTFSQWVNASILAINYS